MCCRWKREGKTSYNFDPNMMALHHLADMKHGSNATATFPREPLKTTDQIEKMNEYEDPMEDQYEEISNYMTMN